MAIIAILVAVCITYISKAKFKAVYARILHTRSLEETTKQPCTIDDNGQFYHGGPLLL